MVSGACGTLTKFVTKAFLGTMGWKQNWFEIFLLKAFQNFSLYHCFLLYHFNFSSKVAIVTFLSFLQFIFVLLYPYYFPTNFYLLIYLCFYMLKTLYFFWYYVKDLGIHFLHFSFFIVIPPLSCFSSTYLYKKLNLSYYSSLSYRNKGENNFFFFSICNF